MLLLPVLSVLRSSQGGAAGHGIGSDARWPQQAGGRFGAWQWRRRLLRPLRRQEGQQVLQIARVRLFKAGGVQRIHPHEVGAVLRQWVFVLFLSGSMSHFVALGSFTTHNTLEPCSEGAAKRLKIELDFVQLLILPSMFRRRDS